jgi:hypothetical protein
MVKSKTHLSTREIHQLAKHVREWEESQAPCGTRRYTGGVTGIRIVATREYSRTTPGSEYGYAVDVRVNRVPGRSLGAYSVSERCNSAEGMAVRRTFYAAKEAYEKQREEDEAMSASNREKIAKKAVARARKLISGRRK